MHAERVHCEVVFGLLAFRHAPSVTVALLGRQLQIDTLPNGLDPWIAEAPEICPIFTFWVIKMSRVARYVPKLL